MGECVGGWVGMSGEVGERVRGNSDSVQASEFQSHNQSFVWRERQPSPVRSGTNTDRPLAIFFGVIVANVHGRVVEVF